jgi:dolichyl-phosphate beta-glucosyltransferase
MAQTPEISIVIPAFNEARRLPGSLERLDSYLGAREEPWELIVVVEKSADETFELALQAAARQGKIRVLGGRVHRGKGYAVRTGMLEARGDLLFFTDADLSTPAEEIGKFLEHFRKNPQIDILVGNRARRDSDVAKRQSLVRRSMGKLFNLVLRMLAEAEIRDTQCGFKAFRRGAARAVFERQTIDGFAFDVEVLLLAQRLGLKVADLPVRWVNSEESTVRMVRDSLRMLRDIIEIRDRLMREMPAAPAQRPA